MEKKKIKLIIVRLKHVEGNRIIKIVKMCIVPSICRKVFMIHVANPYSLVRII